MATYEAYVQAVKKTGFVLENQVAQLMKASGWTVISNKYYEDDHSNTVREVDLVAYRVEHIQHFDVYTVLIVSCKKSSENVWALLARDINIKDPNSDWWPMHTWTNDVALQYRLADAGSARRYHEASVAFGVAGALSVPEVEVFAFQELSKDTDQAGAPKKQKGAQNANKPESQPKNDTTIFNSITSLMKAQAYEIGALPNRKKTPSVYQFNLVAVAETDLLRLMFRDGEIECSAIKTEHYIGRYIIHRKETFSRIRFVQAEAFEESLRDYERLHWANCQWFANECDAFYHDIVKDWRRIDVLLDAFKTEILSFIKWRALTAGGVMIDFDVAGLTYSKDQGKLYIGFDVGPEVIKVLEESKEVNERVAMALKKVYRYSGPFELIEDIPF